MVKNPIFFSWVSWLVEDSDSYPIWTIHLKKYILEARLSQQFLFLQDDSMRLLNIVGYIFHWVFVDVQGPLQFCPLLHSLKSLSNISLEHTFLHIFCKLFFFYHFHMASFLQTFTADLFQKKLAPFLIPIFSTETHLPDKQQNARSIESSLGTSNYLLSRTKAPDWFRGKSMHIIKRFNCFYF